MEKFPKYTPEQENQLRGTRAESMGRAVEHGAKFEGESLILTDEQIEYAREMMKNDFEGVGKTYYEILGVPRDASLDEIKGAYRSQALKVHPDQLGKGLEDRFKTLDTAYQTLIDSDKRAKYEKTLPPYRRPVFWEISMNSSGGEKFISTPDGQKIAQIMQIPPLEKGETGMQYLADRKGKDISSKFKEFKIIDNHLAVGVDVRGSEKALFVIELAVTNPRKWGPYLRIEKEKNNYYGIKYGPNPDGPRERIG